MRFRLSHERSVLMEEKNRCAKWWNVFFWMSRQTRRRSNMPSASRKDVIDSTSSTGSEGKAGNEAGLIVNLVLRDIYICVRLSKIVGSEKGGESGGMSFPGFPHVTCRDLLVTPHLEISRDAGKQYLFSYICHDRSLLIHMSRQIARTWVGL
jgi:hypothetical protein